jgi:hypothetical protein
MGRNASHSCFPTLRTHGPNHHAAGSTTIHIETHGCATEVLRIQMPGTVQATLFANSKQEGNGWMWQFVFQKCRSEIDQHGTSSPVVTSQSSDASWPNNPFIHIQYWNGSPAQWHGIHVGTEHQRFARTGSWKISPDVSTSTGKFHACVGIVLDDG